MQQLCEYFNCRNLKWFLIDPDEEIEDYSFILPYADDIQREYYELMGSMEYEKFYQKTDFITYEKLKQEALIIQIQIFKQIDINKFLGIDIKNLEEQIKIINESFLFNSNELMDAENLRRSIQTTLYISEISEEKKEEKTESWDELVVWVQQWINILMPDTTTVSRFCEYHKKVMQKISWQKTN
jgi:hypothetical protein